MFTINDERKLDNLKTAVNNINVADIIALKEKYKGLVVRKITDLELEGFGLKPDELSNILIANEMINEFKDNEIYCIQTKGDGNCMFRCVCLAGWKPVTTPRPPPSNSN